MIDGTVSVTGTVKVDNTGKLDNLYQIARRAKDNDNIDQAFKYYDQLIVEDPNSWEANFYVAYFSAMQKCKNDEISSPINIIGNSLNSVFDLIEDVSDEKEQKRAATEVKHRVDYISKIMLNMIEHEYNYNAERIDEMETGITNNLLTGSINMYKKFNMNSDNRNDRDNKRGMVADIHNLVEQRIKHIDYDHLAPVDQLRMEKQEEQSEKWSDAGLCKHCGGELSSHNNSFAASLFKFPWNLNWEDRKCKSCSNITKRSYEETKKVRAKKTTLFFVTIIIIIVVFIFISSF